MYSLSVNDVIFLQVMLDMERKQMESAARAAVPKNTDSYDYANYHTLSEVSTHIYSAKNKCYLSTLFNKVGGLFEMICS